MRDPIGVYLEGIGVSPRFTKDQERDLSRRARGGDRIAREQLILSVLPWGFRLARLWHEHNAQLDLADCVQTASIAICRAVDHLDPERGRLTTLVRRVIQSEMGVLLAKDRSIALPINRRPSPRYAREHAQALTVLSLAPAAAHLIPSRGLDEEDSDERGAERRAAFERFVGRLRPRDQGIWRMRAAGHLLAEIASAYGISRQRVLQIITRGVESLREELPAAPA